MLKSSRAELNLECDETVKLYVWYKEKRPFVNVNSISRATVGEYGKVLYNW